MLWDRWTGRHKQQTMSGMIKLLLRAVKGEEIAGLSDSKHTKVTGTCSGKWNRGSPRVPVRPFVSGVESRAAVAEGWWRELSGEGERESDWDKLWCTMEVLIFDRSSDLLKLPRGPSFTLPKGLPSLSSLSPPVPASIFQYPSFSHLLTSVLPSLAPCYPLLLLKLLISHCWTHTYVQPNVFYYILTASSFTLTTAQICNSLDVTWLDISIRLQM